MNPSVKFNYLRKPFKKFSHLKLTKKSKLNDEIHEVDLEKSDSIIENYSGEPSLTGLKGELETAVSQYISQVKELGVFKEGSARDTSCQFTTFKTPALPRKNIKQSVTPDERLLDVKFQLTSEEFLTDAPPYINTCGSDGLDNPLYLNLSDCATGNFEDSKESFYENISVDNSDEDHIYENVEHHFYDTVSNPPRPKLPPKPSHFNNGNKLVGNNKIKKKSYSFSSQTKHEKNLKENNINKPSKLLEILPNVKEQEKSLIVDGSETSDLGSSGSDGAASEEDWPLPPLPAETEVTSEDIPLPPPPPEIALQQLEDEVFKLEDAEKQKNSESKNQEDPKVNNKNTEEQSQNNIQNSADTKIKTESRSSIKRTTSDSKTFNDIELDIDEASIELLRAESFSKKHLKNKLFTLNKGLSAYKHASKKKEAPQPPSVVKSKESIEDTEPLAVRHSVVIELKDSSELPSFHQAETQIKERLETLKSKPKSTSQIKGLKKESVQSQDNGSVCVNIKQEKTKTDLTKSIGKEFNDQVIEISADGTWEMKDSKINLAMESPALNSSPDIDPFTGLPILVATALPDPVIQPTKLVKEYVEPDAYFEDKTTSYQKLPEETQAETSIESGIDDTYSASCVSTTSAPISLSSIITEPLGEESLKNEEKTIVSKSSNCTTSSLEKEGDTDDGIKSLDLKCKEPKKDATEKVVNGDSKAQSNSNNLGAAIMEGYERDLRRKKEDLNLPEVSLLEFGDDMKDIEVQRKNVIEQMTVKAKKKDSWIRTFRLAADNNQESAKPEKNAVNNLLPRPFGVSSKKNVFEQKDEVSSAKQKTITSPSFGAESKLIKKSESEKSKEISESSVVTETANVTEQKAVKKEELDAKAKKIEQDQSDNKVTREKIDVTKPKSNPGRFLGKCVANYVPKPKKTHEEHGQPEVTPKDKTEGTHNTDSDVKKGSAAVPSPLVPVASSAAPSSPPPPAKMRPAAADDSGWEPVANVKFKSDASHSSVDEPASTLPPPPEFSADTEHVTSPFEAPPPPSPAGFLDPAPLLTKVVKNERPARQYVYGADNDAGLKTGLRATLTASKASSHENIIEAEIREQQLREEALRREADIRGRDKSGGASSPSSHASDEGFVDRPLEEVPSPHLTSSLISEGGFTHTLKGSDGEPIIYDAVNPPSEYFVDKVLSPTGGTSETKIALEIRELKEREAELRAIRELREREQQLTLMKDLIPKRRTESAEVEDEAEEQVERENSSSREHLDDHLASLTTTTDEGNFSECGDPTSSEDKSSDGSNSRMMSPDLHPFGSHVEHRQRKVTVKPYEDEDAEAQQPVYTQMKKESVIEREIRLAKEREEAFRREKGLLSPPAPAPPKAQKASPPPPLEPAPPATNGDSNPGVAAAEPPRRGVQHRLATTRIQQEITETSRREKELRKDGKIRTLSEDTVDSKHNPQDFDHIFKLFEMPVEESSQKTDTFDEVTRLSDIASDQESSSSGTARACSSISTASSSFSSLNSSPSRGPPLSTLPKAPIIKRSSSPLSPSYTNSSFTLSPTTRYSSSSASSSSSSSSSSSASSTRLTRSLSTNNLSLGGGGHIRVPQKGLMQKFIASRGKLTCSAFGPPSSPTSTLSGGKPPSAAFNGIATRPMRVSPKATAIRREIDASIGTSKTEEEPTTKIYRRNHATAEEKIQEELRDMKKRETELRRLRARSLARSQPNLAGLGDDDGDDAAIDGDDDDDDDDTETEAPFTSEGVDSSSFLHAGNGLRAALSNPNLLLDDASDAEQLTSAQVTQAERCVRRRSALIAQWEGRIQQTAET